MTEAGRPEEGDDHLRVGLCVSCRHARVVTNRRASRFWLCERSFHEPAYPKYPPLPVLACPGWEPVAEAEVDHQSEGETS